MDKRGLILILLIFSLVAISYAFAHGEHCSRDSDCSDCHPCEGGHCNQDATIFETGAALEDGNRCTGLTTPPCDAPAYCTSGNCYNDDLDSYNYGRCRSNSYWMGPCGSGYDCNSAHNKCMKSGSPDKTCASNYYCKPSTWFQDRCNPKKANGQTCTADYVCISNNCVVDTCVAAGLLPDGSDCDVDSDCASNYCIQTGGPGSTPRCLTPVIGSCPENDEGLSCGCVGSNSCMGTSTFTGDCISSPALRTPCAEGYMCVNDASGSGSCILEPGDVEDGDACTVDADCESTDCYEGNCRSDDNWIGGCGAPSACVLDADYTECVENPGGDTSPHRTCATSYYCKQIFETRVSCAPKVANDGECSTDYECLSNNCDEARGVCTSGEIPELPCAVPSDCAEGRSCIDGECQVGIPPTCTIDDEGEDCDGNEICNPTTEECEIAHSCVTTTSCISQDLEDYSCFTAEPGEGVCRPSVGTDPDDNDEDGDGIEDDVDPCVGSTTDCNAPDSGIGCDDLNGIVCNSGDECIGSYSAISRELNCCTGVNAACSTVSLAVVLGTSIRYTRICSSTNGEALVTVISSGGVDLTSDQCLAMGVNTNQLVPNTPFKCQYREQDWNCGELNIGPQAAGPSVYGYGIIGLLITIGIIVGFYFMRNRKLRFI